LKLDKDGDSWRGKVERLTGVGEELPAFKIERGGVGRDHEKKTTVRTKQKWKGNCPKRKVKKKETKKKNGVKEKMVI